MRKHRTFDYDANNQYQVFVPPGNLKAIGLSLEWTNEAGEAVTLDELGFVRLFDPSGGKVWDFRLSRMYGWVDWLLPGAQRFSSSAGAAAQAFIYIPMDVTKAQQNIVRLGTGYTLEFQHDSLTTQALDLTATVLLQSGLGVQRYMPIYQDFNIRSMSAETDPEPLPRKNVAYVIAQQTANQTVFKLRKDGNILYDLTDEQTDFVVAFEGESKTYAARSGNTVPVVFSLYRENLLTEVIGSDYEFGVVSSDASVEGTTVEIRVDDVAYQTTVQVVQAVQDKKILQQPMARTVLATA